MVDTFKLPNGITVLCEQRTDKKDQGKVAFVIGIKKGSKDEAIDENGLTFLAQESILGGSTTRSRKQVADDAERLGSRISTVTRRTTTEFSTEALTDNLDGVFQVLADIIVNPAFDDDEIESTRSQVLHWIEAENQSPSARATQQYFDVMFAGQSLGKPAMGSKESVASFTTDQVREKYAALLSDPEKIVVSFSGDITPKQAQDLVEKYLGSLTPAVNPVPDTKAEFIGEDKRVEEDNNQLNLRIGFPAPSSSDPDTYNFLLFNTMLSSGISSPLFTEIREKRGLVYSVQSAYQSFDETGAFLIAAGTGKGNAGELVHASLELLGSVLEGRFTQEDLDVAKKRMVRKVRSSGETAMSSASTNMSSFFKRGYVRDITELEEKLSEVSLEDVKRVVYEMLSSGKYAFGGVGPHDTMPDKQTILDTMKEKAALYQPQSPSVTADQAAVSANTLNKSTPVTAKDPQVSVLSNGMKVVTIEREGSVSCGAWVGAGTSHETPELNGATHMNEHMMFKGTPSYPEGKIDTLVERDLLGGLNAYTTYDKTAYYFFDLDESGLETVVDICGEMVFKANIAEDAFDGKKTVNADGSTTKVKGERDVVIEEIKMNDDRVGWRVFLTQQALAFPDQADGKSILGTEFTLRAMSSADLRAYRDQYYSSNNVVFSAAGPIKHEDFVALIEKKFGHMTPTEFEPLKAPKYVGGVGVDEMPQASMCNIGLSMEGVPLNDDKLEAYKALGIILGGCTSSRLQEDMVDGKGLTGKVTAFHGGFAHWGLFGVNFEVEPENVKESLALVYDHIRDVAQSGVSADELDKAKSLLEMTLRRSYESNRKACDTAGRTLIAIGHVDNIEQSAARIRALSAQDIQDVANLIMQSNPALAIVAPVGVDHSLLPDQAELLAMRNGSGGQALGFNMAPR